MPTSGKINRCVCSNVFFSQLKEAGVQTIRECEDWYGCGVSCKLCRPYLFRFLESGETEFELLDEADSEQG